VNDGGSVNEKGGSDEPTVPAQQHLSDLTGKPAHATRGSERLSAATNAQSALLVQIHDPAERTD
jgi:hypothetical protein